MHQDPNNLRNAVGAALNQKLNVSKHADRRLIQKGAYILNHWGYGPRYNFDRDIRGPYSTDLEEDLFDLIVTTPTEQMDVPPEDVARLGEIMSRGIKFAEAYTTILMLMETKPWMPEEEIFRTAYGIGEYLHDDVIEACKILFTEKHTKE